MRNLTEAEISNAVLATLRGAHDERLRQVATSLIRHLHYFIREVEPTEQEWRRGIDFLTATGHMCNDKRQEFILLSDILGASVLVEAINHRKPQGATESDILGPFYCHGAPELPLGADIAAGVAGRRVLVTGRVLSANETPIAGAMLDVWQVRPDQKYDVQDPEAGMQMRGKFRTDAEGRFAFRTLKPVSYPIPEDGPVGSLLRKLGRHPYRPAHIHFIVSAPGFENLITQLFAAGDPYLDSDAVHAVKDSLIVNFESVESEAEARRLGMQPPFLWLNHDFRLATAGQAAAQDAPAAVGSSLR